MAAGARAAEKRAGAKRATCCGHRQRPPEPTRGFVVADPPARGVCGRFSALGAAPRPPEAGRHLPGLATVCSPRADHEPANVEGVDGGDERAPRVPVHVGALEARADRVRVHLQDAVAEHDHGQHKEKEAQPSPPLARREDERDPDEEEGDPHPREDPVHGLVGGGARGAVVSWGGRRRGRGPRSRARGRPSSTS